MWPPQINHLRKLSPVLSISTHIYGISKEMEGKMFIYRVNLGMWPSNRLSWKNKPSSEGFNTHLWGFQGDRWENMHFERKLEHVIPEIICLGKTSPLLRVSTHIYGLSKEIDETTCILRVNLGMWLWHRSSWKNKPCSEGFNTHLWAFQGDRSENMHFESKPRHVTPQIDHLGKTSHVLRVSTHIYGLSKEIDGKTFIFRVNLGMWLWHRSSWKNKHCSEGFNTHLWAFQGDRWENIHF